MSIIQTFKQIRDVPYRIPLSESEPNNCCSGKVLRLKAALEKTGYSARYRVCVFKWLDVDPTWDSGLHKILPISEWLERERRKMAHESGGVEAMKTTLTGKLVELTLPTAADLPTIKKIFNDKETMKALIPFFGRSVWTDEQVKERHERFHRAYLKGRGIDWVVNSLSDKRIVGSCGFKNIDNDLQQGEFGIILHRMVWGKGHAVESQLLCLKYGFEIMKLRRIYFQTDVQNKRMQRFFEKVGIRCAGEIEEGYLEYELLQPESTSVFGKLEEMLTKKILYTGSTS